MKKGELEFFRILLEDSIPGLLQNFFECGKKPPLLNRGIKFPQPTSDIRYIDSLILQDQGPHIF